MANISPRRLSWAAGQAVTACACFSKEFRTSEFWSTGPRHQSHLGRIVIITIPQPDARFLNRKSGGICSLSHPTGASHTHLGLRPPGSSLHSLILRLFTVPWDQRRAPSPVRLDILLARKGLHTVAWKWGWAKRPLKAPAISYSHPWVFSHEDQEDMGSERGGTGSVSQPSGQVRLLDPHALLSDKWLLEDIPAGSFRSWRVWTGLSITQARAFTRPPWGVGWLCYQRMSRVSLLKKKIKHSLSEFLISQSASGFLGSRESPSLTSTFPSDHPHPIPLPNSLFQNKSSLLCCKDPGLGSAGDRFGALP